MIDLIDLHPSLLYRDKTREEYTMRQEDTLDNVLLKMYRKVQKFGEMKIKDAVTAINAAYRIAVALYNTPYLDELNGAYGKMRHIADEAVPKENGRHQSHHDAFLVCYMVWAILSLQKTKPVGMEDFLKDIMDNLKHEEYEYIQWAVQDGDDYFDFFEELSPLVTEDSSPAFETDLAPDPTPVRYLADSVWDAHVRSYTRNDFEQLLSLYRTKEEQHALLDWVDRLSNPDNSLPF